MPNINYYNKLSTYSYETDVLKGNKYYVGEEIVIAGKKVEILDIYRNGTYGDKNQYGVPNHMQAMTVAPNYVGANYVKK